ncbi:tRNA-dihydrouridine synthase [Paenibacillus rhizoplanae]
MRDEIAPHTLLTINGDIADRETGLKLAAEYGVDGIMIGRGIFFIIRLRSSVSRGSIAAENCLICCGCIWTSMINTQDRHHVRSARCSASSKIYVRGFRGASELRNNLMNTKSTREVRALLDEFASQEQDGAEGPNE